MCFSTSHVTSSCGLIDIEDRTCPSHSSAPEPEAWQLAGETALRKKREPLPKSFFVTVATTVLQVVLSQVPADGANNTTRTETPQRVDQDGLGQDPIPGGVSEQLAQFNSGKCKISDRILIGHYHGNVPFY